MRPFIEGAYTIYQIIGYYVVILVIMEGAYTKIKNYER